MNNELFVINPIRKLTFDTQNKVKNILLKVPYGANFRYITECIKYEVDMILQNKYYEKHKETYSQYEKRRQKVNGKNVVNTNNNDNYSTYLALLGFKKF
jgi:hypothetical protein